MTEPPASGMPERRRSCVHWVGSPGWVRRSISARPVLSPPAVTGRLGSGICKAVAPRDSGTRALCALRPSIPRAASWSRRPQTIRPASGPGLEPTCRRSRHPVPVNAAAFSPDSKLVATGAGGRHAFESGTWIPEKSSKPCQADRRSTLWRSIRSAAPGRRDERSRRAVWSTSTWKPERHSPRASRTRCRAVVQPRRQAAR